MSIFCFYHQEMNDRVSPGYGTTSFLQQPSVKTLTEYSGSDRAERVEESFLRDASDLEPIPLISRNTTPASQRMLTRYNESVEQRIANGETDLSPISYNDPTTIAEVLQNFNTVDEIEKYTVSKPSSKVLSTVNNAAEKVKRKLTGKRGQRKNAVETFCTNNWHSVAKSIIILVVLIFLSMSILLFMGFYKLCCSKSYNNPYIKHSTPAREVVDVADDILI